MKLMRKFYLPTIVFLAALWSCLGEAAAQQTVRGIVKSGEDNAPMPFVTVIVKGTQTGVNTDAQGQYSIAVTAGQSLIYSFVGYKSQEIAVNSQSEINVTLQAELKNLNEVLVVGYGRQSRENVTSSISKLDNKVLENISFANAGSALQGSIAGLRVQTTTGQPGAAPRIVLRGGTSINNPNGSAPLYIVDGVIRPNMNDISSEEIESMQVLKDAASTAIYGARASNGVVIITTKSGKAGKLKVSYQYNTSFSKLVNGYDLVSARDYITYQRLGVQATSKVTGNTAYLTNLSGKSGYGTGNDLTKTSPYTTQYLNNDNQHKLQEGWESMPDPIDPTKTIIFQGTNFEDILFRTGVTQNHHISLSGGSDKATFSAGVGYMDAQGITITTKYNRLTFDMNGDLYASDKLRFYSRLMYSNSGNNQVFSDNSIFERSIDVAPTTKYRYEDGTLAPGQGQSIGNPEYHLNKLKTKRNSENLSLAIGANWDILPGLTFAPQLSLYKTDGSNRSFQEAYFNGPATYVSTRTASGSYLSRTQYQADAVFSYAKSFQGKHNLDAKLGFSYFKRDTTGLSGTGQGASTDLIPTLNASAVPVAVGGYESQQALVGYFGNINYDFDQKYLVSLTARYDGASNLGANHQWGFFPGVSVGWNLHKEQFWTALPENLLRLKLRASYGVNGNISGLSDFQSQGQYSVGSQYGTNAAVTNTVLSNADLKWERSKTFDLGADIGLFGNRVNMLFDYYRRVTDNLLTDMSLPQSTGFSSIRTNLGSLENKGVELEVSARILPSSSSLSWDVSFNAAKTTQKILTLPSNGIANNRIGGIQVWDPALGALAWKGGLQEGGRVGDMYSYKQLGIYRTDEEAASAPVDNLISRANKTKYGGDVKWLDVDGNKIIDGTDRVYVGNPYPAWTGGFSNSLGYKGLNLFLRMDYTTGHTIYNYPRAQMVGQFQGDVGLSTEVLKSWKQPGDVTDIPKYYWADQNAQNNLYRGGVGVNGGNSFYYEKGDFLAVREVTLSYTLPKSILSKVKISNLRFNVTANNLHYFTKYKGLNPEDGGNDRGRYPIPRTIILGVNVSL
ncbi:TonB-dependent receptor P39 [Dyadobacter sp. CECT 9275]|uniref:TonB-dependent receptor P39 n=1 Tax=Dyadobacter helix TaxID=2822344 RepID=A0A916NES7_9BACT|nr:TonB-dependent receptor [Dyadobacter sp. CECT 9275]CAG5018615.1 TonB-dependent receptor P39 [Dyadobacter sp. CECT 9275]